MIDRDDFESGYAAAEDDIINHLEKVGMMAAMAELRRRTYRKVDVPVYASLEAFDAALRAETADPS